MNYWDWISSDVRMMFCNICPKFERHHINVGAHLMWCFHMENKPKGQGYEMEITPAIHIAQKANGLWMWCFLPTVILEICNTTGCQQVSVLGQSCWQYPCLSLVFGRVPMSQVKSWALDQWPWQGEMRMGDGVGLDRIWQIPACLVLPSLAGQSRSVFWFFCKTVICYTEDSKQNGKKWDLFLSLAQIKTWYEQGVPEIIIGSRAIKAFG